MFFPQVLYFAGSASARSRRDHRTLAGPHMSSTHLSLHYHIVFGTKNHEPLIQPAWRGNLHAYLGGIIRTADGIAESVGGVSDHVHLLIGLRATHRIARAHFARSIWNCYGAAA